MIKNQPAMGWNTWNTFTENINEELVLQSAEAMVKSGLKDAGYEYVVIDDCWSLRERDKNGRLVPDPVKFPHGMKYVADKIHEMGLKFGMYSCAGTLTCAGYPGSFDHEFIDAATFAEWGVDYLKYDYCYHTVVPGYVSYKNMSIALATCGRDILFSACSWGADDTKVWIKETGANSWRSTGDIVDSWASIKFIATSQLKALEYNGLGCFNDMDMLICGMNGGGTIGINDGCTYDEYFTHFALWCLMGSPLMIGCDIRKMDEATKKYLTNKDLIRINQDKKYCQPFCVNPAGDRYEKNYKLSVDNAEFYSNYNTSTPVIAKYLDDGKIAIGAFNFTDGKTDRWCSSFNLQMVGLPETTGKTLLLRDVITGETFKATNGHFETLLEPHASKVFIAEVVDK